MVKDIQDSFRYYYWNKESELQSGIKREEAVGCTDYEIYGEERGRRYRDVDESLVQAGKVYRAEESYSTVDGIVHDTIAVKSIIKWKEKKKWQRPLREVVVRLVRIIHMMKNTKAICVMSIWTRTNICV